MHVYQLVHFKFTQILSTILIKHHASFHLPEIEHATLSSVLLMNDFLAGDIFLFHF